MFPGQTTNNEGSNDVLIRKYDGDGNEVWTTQFGTSTKDEGRAIAADNSGNVYVAGRTMGTFPDQTNNGQNDVFIAKYMSANTPAGDDVAVSFPEEGVISSLKRLQHLVCQQSK